MNRYIYAEGINNIVYFKINPDDYSHIPTNLSSNLIADKFSNKITFRAFYDLFVNKDNEYILSKQKEHMIIKNHQYGEFTAKRTFTGDIYQLINELDIVYNIYTNKLALKSNINYCYKPETIVYNGIYWSFPHLPQLGASIINLKQERMIINSFSGWFNLKSLDFFGVVN